MISNWGESDQNLSLLSQQLRSELSYEDRPSIEIALALDEPLSQLDHELTVNDEWALDLGLDDLEPIFKKRRTEEPGHDSLDIEIGRDAQPNVSFEAMDMGKNDMIMMDQSLDMDTNMDMGQDFMLDLDQGRDNHRDENDADLSIKLNGCAFI